MTTNPLLESYTVPPLDRITPEHFEAAVDHTRAEAQTRLDAFKANTATPDFENTAVALDNVFHGTQRIRSLLDTFSQSFCSQEMVTANEAALQKISDFKKQVFQDRVLADRLQSVTPATAEDKTLYKKLEREFRINGAFLDEAGKEKIRTIDSKLISLTATFNDNLVNGARQQAVLFTDPNDVKGLPEDIVFALRQNAEDAGHAHGWLVIPERLQIDSLLTIADSRNFRQKIFEALNRIGTQEPYDNHPIIHDILALRHERSQLLGYPHYGAYAMDGMMPRTVDTVEDFFAHVEKNALSKFEDTVRKVQVFAANNDGPRTLEPWDLPYWVSRYREKTLSFDEKAFSQYLPLEQAMTGFFKAAEAVFGVTFRENTSHPHIHDDVRTYDAFDKETGALLGTIHADLFERKHKEGGAWMEYIQMPEPGKPAVVSMNMNMTKPSQGQSKLLTPGDLETLFHEGGHCLHGLLGTKTRHYSLQGPNSTSEFVEFFSNIMEKWTQDPTCLQQFARHYQTGEPLPEDLLKKRLDASNFFSEQSVLKVIQNSRRDFKFHGIDPSEYIDPESLHADADFNHPMAHLMGSYPLTRFSHLFSSELSQYAAGYYGYLWSQSLADLGFSPFRAGGAYDPECCAHLKALYALGSSHEGKDAFTEYLGEPFTPKAMADAVLANIGADKPPRVAPSRTAVTSR